MSDYLPQEGLDYCVTCSDEGRPVTVVDLGDGLLTPGKGRNTFGQIEDIDLTLVPGVQIGDRVLIHAGQAIARLEDE